MNQRVSDLVEGFRRFKEQGRTLDQVSVAASGYLSELFRKEQWPRIWRELATKELQTALDEVYGKYDTPGSS